MRDLFEAFPNGRCPVCGDGLDEAFRCQTKAANEDETGYPTEGCPNYGRVVPEDRR